MTIWDWKASCSAPPAFRNDLLPVTRRKPYLISGFLTSDVPVSPPLLFSTAPLLPGFLQEIDQSIQAKPSGPCHLVLYSPHVTSWLLLTYSIKTLVWPIPSVSPSLCRDRRPDQAVRVSWSPGRPWLLTCWSNWSLPSEPPSCRLQLRHLPLYVPWPSLLLIWVTQLGAAAFCSKSPSPLRCSHRSSPLSDRR